MLLEVRNVRKSYGALEILKDISFDVAAGEAFAVIGPNGAGKTTLFKVLTGESLRHQGSVRFDGTDVTFTPAFQRARLGFGRTFQVARIFTDLTILANVVIAVEARRTAARQSMGRWYQWRPSPEVRDEAEAILRDVGFLSDFDGEARFLSHGDKKRLEFAITLAINPRVLMLDEPTAGMSPTDRKGVGRLLDTLRKARNITIVMTEHDMDVIFGLADKLMVLNYGEVIGIGTPTAVRNDPVVRDVYLGKGVQHA